MNSFFYPYCTAHKSANAAYIKSKVKKDVHTKNEGYRKESKGFIKGPHLRGIKGHLSEMFIVFSNVREQWENTKMRNKSLPLHSIASDISVVSAVTDKLERTGNYVFFTS